MTGPAWCAVASIAVYLVAWLLSQKALDRCVRARHQGHAVTHAREQARAQAWADLMLAAAVFCAVSVAVAWWVR